MAVARDTFELFGVEVQELARPRRIERGDTPAVIHESLGVNPHFSIDPPPRLEDPECRTRDRYMED